jgi:hypothetical protein
MQADLPVLPASDSIVGGEVLPTARGTKREARNLRQAYQLERESPVYSDSIGQPGAWMGLNRCSTDQIAK